MDKRQVIGHKNAQKKDKFDETDVFGTYLYFTAPASLATLTVTSFGSLQNQSDCRQPPPNKQKNPKHKKARIKGKALQRSSHHGERSPDICTNPIPFKICHLCRECLHGKFSPLSDVFFHQPQVSVR